jgi:hypothetical protein
MPLKPDPDRDPDPAFPETGKNTSETIFIFF